MSTPATTYHNTQPVSLSPLEKKQAERAEIEAQLNEWLSQGNTVTHIPTGVGADTPNNDFNHTIRGRQKV